MTIPYSFYSFGYMPQWEQLDERRRCLGKLLDAMGLGPIETSSQVVFAEPAATLRAYVRIASRFQRGYNARGR